MEAHPVTRPRIVEACFAGTLEAQPLQALVLPRLPKLSVPAPEALLNIFDLELLRAALHFIVSLRSLFHVLRTGQLNPRPNARRSWVSKEARKTSQQILGFNDAGGRELGHKEHNL